MTSRRNVPCAPGLGRGDGARCLDRICGVGEQVLQQGLPLACGLSSSGDAARRELGGSIEPACGVEQPPAGSSSTLEDVSGLSMSPIGT